MKVSVIIKNIQQVVKTTAIKITIKNFQKQQCKIFTFDSIIIQLDNTVNNSHLIKHRS